MNPLQQPGGHIPNQCKPSKGHLTNGAEKHQGPRNQRIDTFWEGKGKVFSLGGGKGFSLGFLFFLICTSPLLSASSLHLWFAGPNQLRGGTFGVSQKSRPVQRDLEAGLRSLKHALAKEVVFRLTGGRKTMVAKIYCPCLAHVAMPPNSDSVREAKQKQSSERLQHLGDFARTATAMA